MFFELDELCNLLLGDIDILRHVLIRDVAPRPLLFGRALTRVVRRRGGRNRRRRGGRNRDNRPPRADGQPHPAPQQTNTPQPQAASAANDAGDANGGQRYRYRGGQREGQAPRENYNNGGAAVKLEERPQQSSQPAAAAMGEHDAARQSIIKGLWRKITE